MNGNWLWDKKVSDTKARKCLANPESREFITLAALLLSRKNDPQEVFKGYIDPLVFCRQWAAIKRKMRQDKWAEPRIVFWQAIHDKLADKYRRKGIVFRRQAPQAKEPLYRETGKIIRSIRLEQGLSQKELAEKIGVSQQLISRIEKGGENLSLATLKGIGTAFGKKVEISFVS